MRITKGGIFVKRAILPMLAVVSLLVGCSPVKDEGSAQSESSLHTLSVGLQYLGPEGQLLNVEHQPSDPVLLFPYFTGGIFGNPDKPPLFVVKVADKATFTLKLDTVVEKVASTASQLSSEWIQAGLAVEPSDTRLARVGTFAFDAQTGKEIGAGGFIDSATRDYLILVYVDRACHITGSFESGHKEYQHDILFNESGFHWVRVERIDKEKSRLIDSDGVDGVKFSIELSNLSAV